MNYLPGSHLYGNPNGPYYGYMMQNPKNDRRVQNNYIIDQRSFINQPYQHPQQSYRQPIKRNASIGPSINTNAFANNKMDSFSPNPYWKSQKSNVPTFNAYSPVNYDKVFNGVNSSNSLIQNRHAPVNQIPSTFALASNSLLQRRDMDFGNKSTEFMSFPANQLGTTMDMNTHHLPQIQSNNNLIRSNLLTYSQPNISQGYFKERSQNSSLRTLPKLDESPMRNERRKERIGNPLIRVGVIGLDPRRQDLIERFNPTERISVPNNRNSARASLSRTEANEEIDLREQRRNNNQIISNNHHHHHHNVTNDTTPALIERQQYSISDLFSRPATIRVTIANQDLTNMSLQGLRSTFNSDETFGQELIRINDFINCMLGTPENQINWVTTFIEQFFNQLNEEPKKPGLDDEAIEKLKTKKFKNRKKAKVRKNSDESTTPENLCAICLVDYEEGDEQCFLTCEHNFHKECIAAWLKKKAECPTCRKSVE